jgi:hypothetical protein
MSDLRPNKVQTANGDDNSISPPSNQGLFPENPQKQGKNRGFGRLSDRQAGIVAT